MEKVARFYHLTPADAGWAWTGMHFSAELPPAHGTLHDLLLRLGEHLSKSGEALADFPAWYG